MNYIPSNIIEYLKELNTEDVARKLGMKVVKHRTLCFMHQDTHPSLSFMRNRRGWKCFVCDEGGCDAISFVRKFLQCNYWEACHWLCEAYSIYLPEQNSKPQYYKKSSIWTCLRQKQDSPKIKTTRIYYDIIKWIVSNAKISDDAAKFLYNERCLDRNVVQNLHIGSITSPEKLVQKLLMQFFENDLVEAEIIKKSSIKNYLRVYTPCLLFPYYDIDGNLIGLQSRYIGNNVKAPRFQFIGCKNIPIFNLPILNQLQKGEDLYIAEGVTDCMALLSDGKNAVSIPSASNIPDESLRLLAVFRLHMFPDQDKGAGMRAYRTLRSKLISMGSFIYKEEFPSDFKDYGEYYQDKRRKDCEKNSRNY